MAGSLAGLRELARDWLRSAAGIGTDEPGRTTVYTLTLTRWVAIIGQLFTILLVHSLGITLPLRALIPAVLLSALMNLSLLIRLRANTRLPERSATALYIYDILQLCYLLALTGGVQNPFAALIVVPVALASATLELRSTVLVTGLALLALVMLGLEPSGVPWVDGQLTLPGLYRLGIAAAIIIACILIAVFVWSIAEAARRHADALQVTQLALAREQQLSALGGQAAAAAHLLGTPLGTITIIARELVRELPPGSPLAEEAGELLSQAQRCRELLKDLGRATVEREPDRFTVAPLTGYLEQIASEHARPGVEVTVRLDPADTATAPAPVVTPEIRHSVANLIDNAIRHAVAEVLISVRHSHGKLIVTIEDDGPGFSPEILDWVGEPFISTREEQGGLGLGIFIAITLLARTGAKVHFDNTARGARVMMIWPANALSEVHKGADA